MSKSCSSASSPEFPRILVDFIGGELASLKVDKVYADTGGFQGLGVKRDVFPMSGRTS